MDTAVTDRKAWVTLQAELALAGWQAALTEADDGEPLMVVSRWAMTRSFTDLAEAQTWARQVVGNRCAGVRPSMEARDGRKTG